MSLTLKYLQGIQESGKLEEHVWGIIDIFLSAANDWPSSIVDLDDYEKEIYKLLGNEVTKENLEKFLSQVDFSKYAWEAESLTQLLEVFKYYSNNKLLKEIIEDLKKDVSKVH